MTPSQIMALLDPIKEVSLDAGMAIMKVYQQEDIGLQIKSDKSPITLADQASNKIITEALKKLTPEVPIISEEELNATFDTRKKYTYCWIVDPLDGTKEFVKRNDEFTTNVALSRNGEIILGVVYAPVFQELYWAIKGNGAFKQTRKGLANRISCASFQLKAKGLRIVCSRSHINAPTRAFVEALDEPVLIPKGSSLKMMQIAEGDADLYPRLGRTMEWDTAASQIILEEAGGGLYTLDSNKPLRYNKEHLHNPDFLGQGISSSN